MQIEKVKDLAKNYAIQRSRIMKSSEDSGDRAERAKQKSTRS